MTPTTRPTMDELREILAELNKAIVLMEGPVGTEFTSAQKDAIMMVDSARVKIGTALNHLAIVEDERKSLKLLFTTEWLREKIAADPDNASYEAGSSHPDAPRPNQTAAALLRLHLAIRGLAQIENGVTLFEASPSKSDAAFAAWVELDRAQKDADEALRRLTLPTTHAGEGMVEAAKPFINLLEIWEQYDSGANDLEVAVYEGRSSHRIGVKEFRALRDALSPSKPAPVEGRKD